MKIRKVKIGIKDVKTLLNEFADAAHIAFAESACADFVTCDDRLLKKCLKMRLKIWCGNPLQYCLKENLK